MPATAILDRLLHRSHTPMITGASYRVRENRTSGLTPVRPGPENRPSADDRQRYGKRP